MGIVRESVNRLLGLDLSDGIVGQFKVRAASFYSETHQAIINKLQGFYWNLEKDFYL